MGVSAQAVGVNFLVNTWETGPEARYASLVHPGDSYSYGIFSQAAQAIIPPNSGDPAPLAQSDHQIAALLSYGASQSGSPAHHLCERRASGCRRDRRVLALSPTTARPSPNLRCPRCRFRRREFEDPDRFRLRPSSTSTRRPNSSPGLAASMPRRTGSIPDLGARWIGARHPSGDRRGHPKRVKSGLPVGLPPCARRGPGHQ